MVGFSRGAYTARALTAMLHTVGLLYKDNVEQVSVEFRRKLLSNITLDI